MALLTDQLFWTIVVCALLLYLQASEVRRASSVQIRNMHVGLICLLLGTIAAAIWGLTK